MARIEATVTVTGHFTYDAPAFGAPWKNERHHIWKMVSDDGTLYVWKTTSWPGKLAKGDVIKIAASFKCMKEYNGVMETEVSRVKVIEKLFDAEADREAKRLAKEAAKEAAKKALLDSVTDGDEIITMGYRRYKEHYADCETVPDSYKENVDRRGFRISEPTIDVIVRAGRMKASGTRGKNFATWIIEGELNGETVRRYVYAICPDNAKARVVREIPGIINVACLGPCRVSPRYID